MTRFRYIAGLCGRVAENAVGTASDCVNNLPTVGFHEQGGLRAPRKFWLTNTNGGGVRRACRRDGRLQSAATGVLASNKFDTFECDTLWRLTLIARIAHCA